MSNRISLIIEEIENYVNNSQKYMFSKNKVIINKDEMLELLTELKLKTPEEMRMCQKIIRNRDAIISEAQQKAEEIIRKAKSDL